MIQIISDSTCDLSQELITRYHISILPLHILLGDKEYEDGRGLTCDEIYQWSNMSKLTPKTSAPSIEEAMELLLPPLLQGDDIICFSISASMSTSVNVMRLAAEQLDSDYDLHALDKITIIDSANLSTGVGLLVLAAAQMAQEHYDAAAINAKIEELKPLVRASFVVDTLTFLHRGGRCSGLAAMAGGALHLHPRISVENGAMHPGKKYRGSIDKVIMTYAREMEEDLKKARPDRVFITHSGCDQATIDAVHSYLESLQVFKEILVTRAGGVISSHCGPGTLGVLFIAQ